MDASSSGKESGTDIETMQGLQFNAIEDIEYLRKKLMAAFKVPKSFIGYDEDISGKATLASQDVRFARTIERIQRILISELTKIAIVHLYVQGFTDDSLVNFELSLSNPSTLFEQERINIWKDKFTLAQQMTGGQSILLSQDWVYNNILEMSNEEIEEERKKIKEDLQRQQEQMVASQPPLEGGAGMPPGAAPPEGSEEEPGEDSGGGTIPDESESEEESHIQAIDNILKKLNNEIDDESEDEDEDESVDEYLIKNKGGRPREGTKLATDKHYLGRDPRGHKENTKRYKRSALSMETKNFLESIKISNKTIQDVYKNLLTEDSDDIQIDGKDFTNVDKIESYKI
jgi:hypothetical protein